MDKKNSTPIPPQPKTTRLKDEGTINPFFKETDPRNPYGPNFEELPYLTKVYYKFSRMRKFVHFDTEDQHLIARENWIFYIGVLGSGTLAMLTGVVFRKFILQKYFENLYKWTDFYAPIYYGLLGAGAVTGWYSYRDDYYTEHVCLPLLEKYISTAIDHGFDDYEISAMKTYRPSKNQQSESKAT